LPELRLAGVRWVVTDEDALPSGYVFVRSLNEARDVALFEIEAAAPSIRFATRIFRSPHFNGIAEDHRRPDFDPATDVCLFGSGRALEGAVSPTPPRIELLRETASELRARVEAPIAGVLVWSRSYFEAWEARIDGAPARLTPADGHLVGLHLGPGHHEVVVRWSRRPLAAGAVGLLLGVASAVTLRRRGSRATAITGPLRRSSE